MLSASSLVLNQNTHFVNNNNTAMPMGHVEQVSHQSQAATERHCKSFNDVTIYNRRLGGAQPGNRFVSFVRAYARSGCLVELELNVCWPAFSLFLFCPGELSLFPFGVLSFPFSLPPTPRPPIQL